MIWFRVTYLPLGRLFVAHIAGAVIDTKCVTDERIIQQVCGGISQIYCS